MECNHKFLRIYLNRLVLPIVKVWQQIFLSSIACFTLSCSCRYGCNNGVCQKRQCSCDVLWEGDACDRRVLGKYVGTYFSENSCEASTRDVSLTLGGEVDELVWDGTIKLVYTDSARFDIPKQVVDGQQIQGEGSLLLDRISLRYYSIDTASGLNCIVSASLKDQ